jgi:tetratricopeptide (TPR) repeat protein
VSVATTLFDTWGIAYPLHLVGAGTAAEELKLGNHYFTHDHYDIDKAYQHFNAAVQMDGTLPGAHYQRGRTRFIVGNLAGAMRDVEYEEEINPSLGKVYYMKGLIAGYQKDLPKAERSFKKFIQYDSFNWAGYNDLAWILFAEGKYAEAEKYAQQGLSKTNDNPWLHNSIGVALLAQGKKDDAREHFLLAKEGFSHMTPEQWGIAYPGNNPNVLGTGLSATKDAIEANIQKTQE